MIKELWNVGLKVTDLGREVAFLREVGALLVLRERVSMVGEEREYAILMLARRPHAPLRDGRVQESCSQWRAARAVEGTLKSGRTSNRTCG